MRRGECSLAQKAHLAWLVGARAVVVANGELVDDGLGTVAPGWGGEDEAFEAAEMAPLVLIGREGGDVLEDFLEGDAGLEGGRAGLFVGVEEGKSDRGQAEGEAEAVAAMSLGGYAVVNAKIQR